MASVVQLTAALLLVAVGFAAPFVPGARAATTWDVSIVNYAFQPETMSIEPGDTVRWTNTGSVTHSVVSDAGSAESFDSGPLSPGANWSYTFDNVGVFTYHCSPHTFMHGTVQVGGAIPEFSSMTLVAVGLLAVVTGVSTAWRRR